MRFMEAYKSLEKLCCEMYDNPHGVSAYIEDMDRRTDGGRTVAGWNSDFKRLKEVRHKRNLIAHEPDCSEETVADDADTQWVEAFRARILSESDPLTLYRKAKQPPKPTVSPARTADFPYVSTYANTYAPTKLPTYVSEIPEYDFSQTPPRRRQPATKPHRKPHGKLYGCLAALCGFLLVAVVTLLLFAVGYWYFIGR